MTHSSRVGVICIDCRTDDLSEHVDFWSGLLGKEGRVDPDGKYAQFDSHQGYPKFLLQKVDHDPRVHLDIETDDKEAEVARLEKIGAKVVDRIKGWIVMEAPSGQRFCVVGVQGDDFPGDAAKWGESHVLP